jgi:hypothetical protein
MTTLPNRPEAREHDCGMFYNPTFFLLRFTFYNYCEIQRKEDFAGNLIHA